MKKLNKQGFTLIELLIVIAIIGLLSTLAVVSLSSARAKARDAKRLSDVKQISTALEIAETENPGQALERADCSTAVAINDLTPTLCDIGDLDWSNFSDPVGTVACDAVTPINDVCQYTIATAAQTTADYEICFFTEQTSAIGASAVYRIQEGGSITAGCST